MAKSLVFMAAGFGSRFGGGVKQLEPVGPSGEVLMDFAVHDALRAGFDRVVFIVRREQEAMFREGVGRRTEARCAVEYVHQELDDLPVGFKLPEGRIKPWGTGQAVLACRDILDGPFCVLNADDYYGAEAFQRIHHFLYNRKRSGGLELCMAGYVLGNTLSESGAVTRGICRVRPDGHLDAIRETRGVFIDGGVPCVRNAEGEIRRLPKDAVVSMNIWGMPLEFVDYLREGFERFLRGIPAGDLRAEYLVPGAVGEMLSSGIGSVEVLPTHDHWFGMTYAEDKALAQQHIRRLMAEGKYAF